jgi:hypothetical protein
MCETAAVTQGVTLERMKLGVARLCLDCDEVHDLERCPTCASEVFAYLTRWVPRANGRLTQPKRPVPERPEVDAYRQITGQEPKAGRRRLFVGSAVGLGVLGVAGWRIWRRSGNLEQTPESSAASEKPTSEEPS